MGLKERLKARKVEEDDARGRYAARVEEERSLMEKYRKEKRKEVDDLALVALQSLKPLLDVVNEEWLSGQGTIMVNTGGPYLRGDNEEYKEPYGEVELTQITQERSSPGYFDSYSGFALILRVARNRKVTVGRHSENSEYSAINLDDEAAREKIEDAIYSIITETDECHFSGGGGMDRHP
ncbi:MAG: hypothetical protein IH859_04925 [Chloroflexi bacterium]|nr:hypothetical protein [Chloroflexota bacterium]